MDPKKLQKTSKDTIQKNRRSFLKKAAYTAPSLLVLGTLVRPAPSHAGESQISNGPDDGWATP